MNLLVNPKYNENSNVIVERYKYMVKLSEKKLQDQITLTKWLTETFGCGYLPHKGSVWGYSTNVGKNHIIYFTTEDAFIQFKLYWGDIS